MRCHGLLQNMQQTGIKKIVNHLVSLITTKEKCARPSIFDNFMHYPLQKVVQFRLRVEHIRFIARVPVACSTSDHLHRDRLGPCFQRSQTYDVHRIARHPLDSPHKFFKGTNIRKGLFD